MRRPAPIALVAVGLLATVVATLIATFGTTVPAAAATTPPTLTQPASSTVSGPLMTVSYTLPQTPLANSVNLQFVGGSYCVVSLADANPGAFTLDLTAVSGSARVTGTTCATIPDGSYTVALTYRNSVGDTPASAFSSNVVVDTVTTPATVTRPVTSTRYSTPLPLRYTLPETPKAGSVTVGFAGATPCALTMGNATSVDVALDPRALLSSPGVAASTCGAVLPDGTYGVSVSYRDSLDNTAATSTVIASVVVDTTTQQPTLTRPAASSASTRSLRVAYSLPEAPTSGTVRVSFAGPTPCALTMTDATTVDTTVTTDALTSSPGVVASTCGAALADGTYSVTVTYQDALANPQGLRTATAVAIAAAAPATTAPSPTAPSPTTTTGPGAATTTTTTATTPTTGGARSGSGSAGAGTTAGDDLAFTGATTAPALLVGAGAVVAGAGLLILRRPRRRRQD